MSRQRVREGTAFPGPLAMLWVTPLRALAFDTGLALREAAFRARDLALKVLTQGVQQLEQALACDIRIAADEAGPHVVLFGGVHGEALVADPNVPVKPVFLPFVGGSAEQVTAAAAGWVGKGIAYLGTNLSPALLGVGYILGYRQSAVCVAGALVSALPLTPLIAWLGASLSAPLYPETERLVSQMSADDIWSRYVRYIGAGAVATAGILTVLRGLPTIIHEQNAVIGRANKLLAPRVRWIATGFAMAIPPGPINFAVFEKSIHGQRRIGVAAARGHAVIAGPGVAGIATIDAHITPVAASVVIALPAG